MLRRIFLSVLWLTFVGYAFIYVNSVIQSQESDWDLIVKLSLGQFTGINPFIVAIFLIMGIFPTTYAAFILFDADEQKIPPAPFAIASFALGAFALLPYLVLRKSNTTWQGNKNWILKILDSSLLAIIASIAMLVLLIWGVTQGNWSDFVTQWQSSMFINVMSIDFCILSLLFPAIAGDDLKRRGVESGILKFIPYVPLLGGFIYWCFRPKLPETESSTQAIANS
ncbi:MAG: DUF2834 domain-containing protein [Cyanobacteria bacterium P01_A01_bin.83]